VRKGKKAAKPPADESDGEGEGEEEEEEETSSGG
jgi:hypothetical protein